MEESEAGGNRIIVERTGNECGKLGPEKKGEAEQWHETEKFEHHSAIKKRMVLRVQMKKVRERVPEAECN